MASSLAGVFSVAVIRACTLNPAYAAHLHHTAIPPAIPAVFWEGKRVTPK